MLTYFQKIKTILEQSENTEDISSLVSNYLENEKEKFNSIVFRMTECYKQKQVNDFLSNLRQLLVCLRVPLELPRKAVLWCAENENEYDLVVDKFANKVEAKAYSIGSDEELKFSYDFSYKRNKIKSTTDSSLLNYFGYDSYISLQQKVMIYLTKQLKQGDTMLACIPTGSGKSLTWQLAIARGQFSGVVVVIVPTIALALDHKKNDEITLSKLPWLKSIAYTSKEYADSPDKMEKLSCKIENGDNFILYISPEGMTNFKISSSLEKAAQKKRLSAIVIDETHLVIDWGMKFRPEFQFLPAFISKLKLLSENTFYTYLLSATITENDRNVLYSLFGKNIIEFRGDELRPEIEYYAKYCKDEEAILKAIGKLVKTVPRPAIIYTGTVDRCKKIHKFIIREGFKRSACFYSDVPNNEKERLLEDWKQNKIDIMVATSAFGMGVDKADVRTVVTAYTPENVSRYYQEVGRAGRDGYSALNFVLYCPQVDEGTVSNFTDSELITKENLAARWKAMERNKKSVTNNATANEFWVSTNVAPQHLKYERTGERNSNWNENTLSMLARYSLLKILDVRREYTGHNSYNIKVLLNDDKIGVLEDEDKLIINIKKFREEERNEIVEGRKQIKEMLSNKEKRCFAKTFANEFIHAAETCNGCPYCRKNNFPTNIETGEMALYGTDLIEKRGPIYLRNDVSQTIRNKDFAYFSYQSKLKTKMLNELILELIAAHANIIVMNHPELIEFDEVKKMSNDNYMVLTMDEFKKIPECLYFGTIVFIFDGEADKDEIMLETAKNIKRTSDSGVIVVVPENYYDKKQGRYLADYADSGKKFEIIIQEDKVC